jgi:hypothetical protein
VNWKLACVYALSEGVPQRSLWVALIVGTVLNLINQGDSLLAGQRLDLAKIVLTYLVPYLVSTYGAVSFRLHAAQHHASHPVAGLGPAIHEVRRASRTDHPNSDFPGE